MSIITMIGAAITARRTPSTPEQTPCAVPSLRSAFLRKYPDDERILRYFEDANLCSAEWANITKTRLRNFVEYMQARLAPNSALLYATKLKALLNMYADEVELPTGYAKALAVRKVATTNVYLNERELKLLVDYTPKNDRERFVRNMFIISAYCGARHSDAIRLNESNIVDNTLQYVSVKTHIPTTVPLKPAVADYLRDTPRATIDDTTYNKIIRRICARVGICNTVKIFRAGREQEGEKWRFVGSHTSRRSFATNLYLRGVDIYTISKLLGHSSVKVTASYIQSGARTDSAELMGYFK